jgi:DNA replication and repair protein RecF
MYLSHLHLEQFRCYDRLGLDIPAGGLRLAGANASGKTSFLEAIRLLSTMRSARASAERELINWESNAELGLPPYSRLSGNVQAETHLLTIEIALSIDPDRPTHTRKQIRLNGAARRAIDVVGMLKTVLFEPEDMELILGAPSVRRRYLDLAMSTQDSTYLKILSQYTKILDQRNSLLKSMREPGSSSRRDRMAELEYWDHELIQRAAFIIAARARYLERLTEPLSRSFQELIFSGHQLSVGYASSSAFPEGFQSRLAQTDLVDAQRNVIEWLERDLANRRDEEFRRGVTVIGPQRDDMKMLLDGREMAAFGSRGQQRIAVVSLKLAEIETVRISTGETPVLLLDDVLSELDADRRRKLLELIAYLHGQVIVTATDSEFLKIEELAELPLYDVTSGDIILSSDES